MHCRMKVEKPDDIEYTLTITMKASDWGKLRDQLDASNLSQSYPAYTMRAQVNDLLAQARKVYWPLVDEQGRTAAQRAADAQAAV